MARVNQGRLLVRAAAAVVVVGLGCAPMATRAVADGTGFTITGAGAAGLSMSGMTRDNEAGLYWVVKSPNSPTVVSVDANGKVAGNLTLTTKVTNVQALSWRNGILHVGDIGGQREQVVVLAITDPGQGQGRTSSYTLRYPDGAHDAAALMVSPRGNLYLVTTGTNPGFYRPVSTPVDGGTVDLRRVATAPAGVTDGTFLSDGQRLALRTPIGIQLYDAFTFERLAMGPSPDQIVGDSLTEEIDGGQLVVGYGGTAPRASVMDYPTGTKTSSPIPSPTTSPKASASAGASASPTSATDGSGAPATTAPSVTAGATGTLISLGIAALVAAVAGAVTLIGRRR